MKIKGNLIAALALCLCLTACGSTDDSSSKSGTVSVAETTTTAAETTATTTESTEETTSQTTEKSEESSTTTKKTKAETKASTTQTTTETTTATTTETTTETTTVTSTEATKAKPDPNSFEGKVQVEYNGVQFGLGDNINDIEKKLGTVAPTADVQSCVDGSTAQEYYFYGMTVQAKGGVINSIDIMDNAYYGDKEAKTASGLSLNSKEDDIVKSFGQYSKLEDGNYYYNEGSVNMQITAFGGIIARIWIHE